MSEVYTEPRHIRPLASFARLVARLHRVRGDKVVYKVIKVIRIIVSIRARFNNNNIPKFRDIRIPRGANEALASQRIGFSIGSVCPGYVNPDDNNLSKDPFLRPCPVRPSHRIFFSLRCAARPSLVAKNRSSLLLQIFQFPRISDSFMFDGWLSDSFLFVQINALCALTVDSRPAFGSMR